VIRLHLREPGRYPALTSITLTDPISTGSTTTRNPGISGTVVNAGFLAGIAVEVDLNANGTPDQFATTDALGNYSVDLAVAAGAVSVQFRTREIEAGTGQVLYSGWTTFAFTYEVPTNAVPAMSSFTLKTDTGIELGRHRQTAPSGTAITTVRSAASQWF
jgi:hypothetical protein